MRKNHSLIKYLMDEFYACEAKWNAGDLEQMGTLAIAQFKKKHPNVANEVVEALAWCYTFDFK